MPGSEENYEVVWLGDRPDLAERLPFGPGWPQFVFHDPIAARYIGTVDRVFADLNLVLLSREDAIVAGGWGVALTWDGTAEGLPRGWDGALERAVQDHERGGEPDALSAMATEVTATHRGKGLSRLVLVALRERALERGLEMIAPVRPTLKHRYPLTPIDRYVRWTSEEGAPFDPWLRTHWRLGASVLAVAPHSMLVAGTISEWEEWTGLRFPESGRYVVPDALDLVTIDVEGDHGEYVEPGVWVRHELGA